MLVFSERRMCTDCSIDFLDFLNALNDYKDIGNIYRQIELSNRMYSLEDSVSTGVDILMDFVVTPFQIEGLSDANKDLINEWSTSILNESETLYRPFVMRQLFE